MILFARPIPKVVMDTLWTHSVHTVNTSVSENAASVHMQQVNDVNAALTLLSTSKSWQESIEQSHFMAVMLSSAWTWVMISLEQLENHGHAAVGGLSHCVVVFAYLSDA